MSDAVPLIAIALACNPKCVKIVSITGRSTMAAMTLRLPVGAGRP